KDHIEQTLQDMETQNLQLNFFEQNDPAVSKLKQLILDLNLNAMTPIECMLKLNELKQILEEIES
ncbi:MAG: hypothetical protein OEM26_18190, partial [Saprospiraceae bacterium]|nr:hypothetical protein [Saprospiraceae bacterium]